MLDSYLGLNKEVVMRNSYPVFHKSAKLICFLVNTILGLLILEIDNAILFGVMNFTYFFGVNTIGYVLEVIFKVKHKHDRF